LYAKKTSAGLTSFNVKTNHIESIITKKNHKRTTLAGSVEIKINNSLFITTKSAVLKQKNSRINKIELNGDVVFIKKNNSGFKINADRIIYFVLEQKLQLIGNVTLKRKLSVAQSENMQFDLKNNIIISHGSKNKPTRTYINQ
jgi:lipopolysaccharide transport protein LptA